MRQVVVLIGILVLGLQLRGHEYRNLLQTKGSMGDLNLTLLKKEQWIKYPAYSERAEWDKLLSSHKNEIIARGEKALDYKWQVVTASDYLEFDRSGSRDIMQKPFGENTAALEALVMAELAEGEGRFTQKLADGVWYFCEVTSWVLSAHVSRAQKENTALPSFRTNSIDLTAGDLGSLLAWTYYFFHEEFDKIQPLISQRLYTNLDERILKPYMQRSDFWWQAFYADPETMVNNWNPWCNFNVLTCLLLIEDDKRDLVEGVYRTMLSVDKFINYTKTDGACEEGPSYWGHAAGKMFDYLDLLSKATGGRFSIFDQPVIKNMGEYIAKSYVGDGWVVNFADASPQSSGGGKLGVIFRYGQAVGSNEMQHFAAHMNKRSEKSNFHSGRDIFRTLENLRTEAELNNAVSNITDANFVWYPETEFCYMRNKNGFFVAAKGGYNNESHNHNDMGTFSLYSDNTPMIIDIGVGTYTRQTFSSERYSIWTMQSNYHNLPVINGVSQEFGSKYRSKNISVSETKSSFSVDLSGAYSEDAKVKSWERTYKLSPNNELLIEDKYALSEIKGKNQLNFMTWGLPYIQNEGLVIVEKDGKQIQLKYNPKQFEAEIETIQLKDKRLSGVWGEKVYRLSLNAREMKLTDNYKITISK
ncbi:heparinase II/III family protein [Prolixibacteraceae bacterium Z1-6]|uniref:Heparinase II/III family protein n=1 Tax=Draconibacterium aestuarii TaxID=2998507 RepID=A0A9X3J4Z8_9BACT|nr:heparinase II/III family protein [Prolixibacteraceae bacterium Z1-6]